MELYQMAGLVLLAAWAYRTSVSRQQGKQAQLDALQFWRREDAWERGDIERVVHFPSMRKRRTVYSSDGGPVVERRFFVRRTGDGIWEELLSLSSYEIEVAMLRDRAAKDAKFGVARDTTRDLEATRAEKGKWRPMIEAPEVETAYQRFIHAQGIRVIDIAPSWEQAEAMANERERQTFLSTSQAEGFQEEEQEDELEGEEEEEDDANAMMDTNAEKEEELHFWRG
jgi:hypothetical protein